MSTPQKYRKKPVVIEAVQWDGEVDSALNIINYFAENAVYVEHVNDTGKGFSLRIDIPTLEGTMAASPGDFIIRGVNGEFYPCKPDIFAKTYEAAE